MFAKSLKTYIAGIILAFSIPVHADVTQDSTAIMVLDQNEHSIPRGNMVYTSLVVSLQQQILEANQEVSSLSVDKKNQPNWSEGLSALDAVIDLVNDPALKTVIIIDAEKQSVSENQVAMKLNYQFYDAEAKVVYRSFHADGVIDTSNCSNFCELQRTIKEFHNLSTLLSTSVVASLTESELPTIAQAQ